ncbi:hypothetical protein [Nocardia cyriacigeorgica]|uniref:hypothetical protein n=1 Tax=Nocardia cyriacigeorgica TaxID=135487 RepID=UPI0018957F27|nr:hypothetical protein [Nocardia cyriacigeorgica]MBF6326812.1 hypothetical protein [Nocardia cyriacigeorgica]
MNLGYLFLAAELLVVLGVAAAIVIRKVWPPIECPVCGGHGCDECGWTGSDDADLVGSVPDSNPVEVDGGRPVHELDYAQRMDGAR